MNKGYSQGYKGLMEIPVGTEVVRVGESRDDIWVRGSDELDNEDSVYFYQVGREHDGEFLDFTDFEIKEFTLDDLVPGKHIVKTRDGDVGIYLLIEKTPYVLFSNDKFMGLENHNKDLTHSSPNSDLDIVQVSEISTFKFSKLFTQTVLVWEEKEKKKMTKQQIVDALGYDFDLVEE